MVGEVSGKEKVERGVFGVSGCRCDRRPSVVMNHLLSSVGLWLGHVGDRVTIMITRCDDGLGVI